jgi:hypothetical protein
VALGMTYNIVMDSLAREIRKYPALLGASLLLLSAIILPGKTWAQDQVAEDDPAPNPAGIILRRNHSDEFVGGEEVMVSVNVTAASDATLYALGLYETAPAGWTFEGLIVDSGPPPDILPPLGATGVLEFGWVSPAVPVTFRYALRVPPKEAGARIISGQVEYRLESNPRRNSAPVLSRLSGEANETPVLTLLGASVLSWPEGQPFVDPGASAQDKEDGDISGQVQTAGLVDVGSPGDYTLIYGVVDSAGNRAEPVTRQVRVGALESTDDEEGARSGTLPGLGVGAATGMIAGKTQRPRGTPGSADDDGSKNPSVLIPGLALGANLPALPITPGEKADSVSKTGELIPSPTGRDLAGVQTDRSPSVAVLGSPDSRSETTNGWEDSATRNDRVAKSFLVVIALFLVVLVLVVIAGRLYIHGTRPRRRPRN